MLRTSTHCGSRGLNPPYIRRPPDSSSLRRRIVAGRDCRDACPSRQRCFSSQKEPDSDALDKPKAEQGQEGDKESPGHDRPRPTRDPDSLRHGIENGQSSYYTPPGWQANVSPARQARLHLMEQAAVTLRQLHNERITFPGLFVPPPPPASAGNKGSKEQEPARDGDGGGAEGGANKEEGARAEEGASGKKGKSEMAQMSAAAFARTQAEKEARVLAGALRILQKVLVREVATPDAPVGPGKNPGVERPGTPFGGGRQPFGHAPLRPFEPLKGLFDDADVSPEGDGKLQPLGKVLPSKAKAALPKPMGKVSPAETKRPPKAGKETAEKAPKAAKGTKGAKKSVTSSPKKVTISKGAQESKSKTARPRVGGKSAGDEEGTAVVIESVSADSLVLTPVPKPQPPVPGLSFGLDRALFNPGVYHLQDPRSRVYSFDPYLARIMPIHEFDFQALKQYITSSKDNTLTRIAAEHGKRYSGSTSSMTGILAHFHFLLSSFRDLNYSNLSRNFTIEGYQPTLINKAPSAGFLHWKDGTYAIDADKEFDNASILTMLGKSMEKLLTLPKEEFEKYRRSRSNEISPEERNERESYHYSTLGDFMMRSQLDAHDPRMPGTGMFDLKTRAVISIRMNTASFHLGQGYEIRGRFGQWDSFEREYHDMIRSAFLKYSLQVRMGRMDGIFVAYHNTERIFGFQYVPLSEMDVALHGTENTKLGDDEFRFSLHLLNKLLDRATAKYPGQSLRIHVEARPAANPSDPSFMYFFAKPVTGEEIERIQSTQRAAVDKFEREILGLGGEREEAEDVEQQALAEGAPLQQFQHGVIIDEDAVDPKAAEDDDETTVGVWEDVMDKVEEMLRNEEEGVTFVREAIADAFEQSGLLQGSTPEEAQRYLDKLLELVTADAQETSSAAAEPLDPAAQEAGEAAQDDDVQQNEQGSEAAEAKAGAAAAEEPAAPAEEHEDEKEPSLKDLIVRIASQVRHSQTETESLQEAAQEEEAERVEEQKLRKFERIVVEMIAKGKAPSSSSQTGAVDDAGAPGAPATESLPQLDGSVEETSPAAAAKGAQTSRVGPTSSSPAAATAADEPCSSIDAPKHEMMGMILTIKNKVNGQYVQKPEALKESDAWTVEYAIEHMTPERARVLFPMTIGRREKAFKRDQEDADRDWHFLWRGMLAKKTKAGRAYRRAEDKASRDHPLHVYGVPEPLKWHDVFADQPAAPAAAGVGQGQREDKEKTT